MIVSINSYIYRRARDESNGPHCTLGLLCSDDFVVASQKIVWDEPNGNMFLLIQTLLISFDCSH